MWAGPFTTFGQRVSQAQTLTPYVDAGGRPPDSLLASRTSFRAGGSDADPQEWKTGAGCSSVTANPARTALKISQLTDGGMPPSYDSMH
jgi:hypothetical protein